MPRSDRFIRADLVDRLQNDPRVPVDAVVPEVDDGRVILRGSVPSHRSVQAALIDAWSVGDVRGVDNQLSVDSGNPDRSRTAVGNQCSPT